MFCALFLYEEKQQVFKICMSVPLTIELENCVGTKLFFT